MHDILSLHMLAQSSGGWLTWNPATFFVAAAVAQAIVIYVGYRFLGTDPLYATFFNACLAAGISALLFYWLRGYEELGVLLGSLAFIGLLFAFSGGDMLRSIVVFLLAMATYFGAGHLAVSQTQLTSEQLKGPAELLMNGGFKADPLKPGEAEKVFETGESAVE